MKFLLIISVVVLAALVGTFLFLSRDVVFNDTDLLLESVYVQEADNAFFVFERATNVEGSIENLNVSAEDIVRIAKILEENDWDADFVDGILKRNSTALLYFNEFLRFPVLQFPELQDPENYTSSLPLRSMGGWRLLAKLKALESLALFKQGREKDAFDKAMDVVQFGQLWEDSPRPFLIQYMVGRSMKELGLRTMRRMLLGSSLTSQEILPYVQELEQYGANRASLITTMKAEYMTIANEILGIETARLFGGTWYLKLLAKSPYHFKRNETKLLFAEEFRLLINNIKQEYYNQTQKSEPFFFYPKSVLEMIIIPNSIGRDLFGTLIFDPDLAALAALEDFEVRGTQTMLALKAYYRDNGFLPGTLGMLAPNYLDSEPRDPFDGNALRFSALERVIYSIGENLQETAEDKNPEGGTAFRFE